MVCFADPNKTLGLASIRELFKTRDALNLSLTRLLKATKVSAIFLVAVVRTSIHTDVFLQHTSFTYSMHHYVQMQVLRCELLCSSQDTRISELYKTKKALNSSLTRVSKATKVSTFFKVVLELDLSLGFGL